MLKKHFVLAGCIRIGVKSKGISYVFQNYYWIISSHTSSQVYTGVYSIVTNRQ